MLVAVAKIYDRATQHKKVEAHIEQRGVLASRDRERDHNRIPRLTITWQTALVWIVERIWPALGREIDNGSH